MSTLAKIFSFIVLVCAIAFVSAMWVLSEQTTNWRKAHDDLKKQTDADITRLTKERDDAVTAKNEAVVKRDQAEEARKTAEALSMQYKVTNEALQSEKNQLEQKNLEMTKSLDGIKNELAQLQAKLNRVEAEKAQAITDRNDAVKAQKLAEDNLAKAEDDIRKMREMLKLTQGKLDDTTALIDRTKAMFGEEWVRWTEDPKATPPALINGRVANADNASGIVEITIGKDDGVAVGQTFEVVRPEAGQFVGRVRVERIYDERAICRLDRTMTTTMIVRGDHVTTRVK